MSVKIQYRNAELRARQDTAGVLVNLDFALRFLATEFPLAPEMSEAKFSKAVATFRKTAPYQHYNRLLTQLKESRAKAGEIAARCASLDGEIVASVKAGKNVDKLQDEREQFKSDLARLRERVAILQEPVREAFELAQRELESRMKTAKTEALRDAQDREQFLLDEITKVVLPLMPKLQQALQTKNFFAAPTLTFERVLRHVNIGAVLEDPELPAPREPETEPKPEPTPSFSITQSP